jgi:hypothetical protein
MLTHISELSRAPTQAALAGWTAARARDPARRHHDQVTLADREELLAGKQLSGAV